MQLSIYLILALVALSAAKQLAFGPKISKEASQSLESSNSPDKRYATKEIILYLTPSEIKALQAAKISKSKESLIENKQEEQQLSFQDYNSEQQQNEWSHYFKSLQAEEPKKEWQGAFYSEDKPVTENQADSVDAYNFNFEQYAKEQQQNVKNQEEGESQESEWNSFNSAAKKQEEALLQDQLQQHWNRILNHNRAQLRGLSAINKEEINSESSNDSEKPARPENSQPASRNQEDMKSDIEKQIELILKEASDFEKQNNRGQASRINQRPPIVIHKEVRIIKHHPVPVIERVKVPVPRPILVPVPEPYEVKVPHPYPVPFKVVKHIPVPVIRNK